MRTVKITLPLPNKQLSPNARCHWRVKAKAVKAARTLAYCEAINAGCAGEKWRSATMQATFYFNLNRGRDRDNAASSLKSHVDGVALAGLLVNDTGLTPLPPILIVDKNEKERVELFFSRTDSDQ
jgi:crossover junction endodeoxyribonuclease RusA